MVLYLEFQNARGSMITKLLPCEDIDGVISLINNECDVIRGSGETEVFVTGVGANRNKEKFEKELNVRYSHIYMPLIRNQTFCYLIGPIAIYLHIFFYI